MPTNNKGLKELWGYPLIDEKARNAISDTRSSLENDFQKKTDDTLGTTDKTVPGAINEIKNNIDTIGDNFTSEKTDTKYDMKYNGKSIGSIDIELKEDQIAGGDGSFNIDLTPYQTKTDTSLSTTSKTISGAINEINTECKDILSTINLKKFITNDNDNTIDIQNALSYCKNNNKSLYIPDGAYYLTSPITIDQEYFNLIGESQNVKFYISHTDYAISLDNHRITLKNFRILPKENTNNYKFNGIHVKGSQCLLDGIELNYVNEGIKFSTDSWCSNVKNLSIRYSNKGIIFSNGSGGNYIDFKIIDGSAGYDNTQDNGSIGITFEEKTGHHIIGDGGQISSFTYAFDYKCGTDFRPSQIGKVYIEHCLHEFTSSSKGILSMAEPHIPLTYEDTNIIKITNNGVNKATYFNNAKDSAIPINDLLCYFDFKRGSLFTDKSGNGSTISGENKYEIQDEKNLFGKSSKLRPPTDGSTGKLNIPNLGNQFSIIISSRKTSNEFETDNIRLFELHNKVSDNTTVDLIMAHNAANILVMYDRIDTPVTKNILILNDLMKNNYNDFLGISIDLDNGTVEGFSPNNYMKKTTNEKIKTLAGNFELSLLKAWNNCEFEVINYFAVFDGLLTFDNFLNIYRQVKPLV